MLSVYTYIHIQLPVYFQLDDEAWLCEQTAYAAHVEMFERFDNFSNLYLYCCHSLSWILQWEHDDALAILQLFLALHLNPHLLFSCFIPVQNLLKRLDQIIKVLMELKFVQGNARRLYDRRCDGNSHLGKFSKLGLAPALWCMIIAMLVTYIHSVVSGIYFSWVHESKCIHFV